MALWMEGGASAATEGEKADLEAIAALKLSAAQELKEEGNRLVRMGGRDRVADAVDLYSRAIAQRALTDAETSILFANRAHANLLLGNHRRALADAEEAIALSSSNVKAYYRAGKAASSLNLLEEAVKFCQAGLQQSPSNEELTKLLTRVDERKKEEDDRRMKVSQAITAAEQLVTAIDKRGLQMGKASFLELTGLRKPIFDGSGILHWPVLLLYAEVMSTDFIEDFAETDAFSLHIDVMFSESAPPLPWDGHNAYTRDAIELYYQASVGTLLSKGELLKYLLDGAVDSTTLAENLSVDLNEEDDMDTSKLSARKDFGKWIKVKEKKTLLEILQQDNYIIPGIPVFVVISKKSEFYDTFRSGKWSPP